MRSRVNPSRRGCVRLMSVAGIAFMLGMAVFFVRYILRHMQEDEARDKAAMR